MRVVGDDTGIVPRGAASRSDALPLPVESGKHPAPADRRPREPPDGPVGRPGRHLDQTECFAHIDPTDVALRHAGFARSEEHTSELQSRVELVCRLLLEKKKTIIRWGPVTYVI